MAIGMKASIVVQPFRVGRKGVLTAGEQRSRSESGRCMRWRNRCSGRAGVTDFEIETDPATQFPQRPDRLLHCRSGSGNRLTDSPFRPRKLLQVR